MKILFTKHNVTIHDYLQSLHECEVHVFHNKQAHKLPPENCIKHVVVYRPRFVADLFNLFSVSCMYPQYVRDFQHVVQDINPSCIFCQDFSHFLVSQVLHYKKRHPKTKVYIWSETRQWPSLWLTRWIMYGFWWYFKRNVRNVEKVFVFTEQGRQFFQTHAPEVAVEILPAPVDTSLFYPEVDKIYLLDGTLRILMNARFVALKEHKTLFAAVAQLQEQGVAVQVSLIGRGGHLEGELKERAKALGIDACITWLAPVPPEQLREIYTAHDVLVLPSNREAIGMVVPEAMACGLATVTSDAVGANTYVVEGETGYIFKTGDAMQLAQKLELLSDKNVAERMGKAAAQEIQTHYSATILGKRLETILSAHEPA